MWRIRVSIPVPRRCERRALPIEPIPPHQSCLSYPQRDSNPQSSAPETDALSIRPWEQLAATMSMIYFVSVRLDVIVTWQVGRIINDSLSTCSTMVSISGSQPGDPGSIPGRCKRWYKQMNHQKQSIIILFHSLDVWLDCGIIEQLLSRDGDPQVIPHVLGIIGIDDCDSN